MGSMLKADSERRELVRERRQARIARKQERRDARERKHSEADPPPAPSGIQRAAQERVEAELDRIVTVALQRHDRDTATASLDRPASVAPATRTIEERPAGQQHTEPAPADSQTVGGAAGPRGVIATAPLAREAERTSRRERDIAAFRERRRQAADEARAEARQRIARAGEVASVADALAALAHSGARAWEAERQELQRALQGGRIVDVGAVARRSLWAISRDAARSSRRARRDPDLALAACVAYAIIARLPRCAVRSAQRTRPAVPARAVRQRAFWR
jgi:hypothetical protein